MTPPDEIHLEPAKPTGNTGVNVPVIKEEYEAPEVTRYPLTATESFVLIEEETEVVK